MHAAKLRVELSQSKREQQEYLKNVELARVLDKRADRKRKAGEELPVPAHPESVKKARTAEIKFAPEKEKKSKAVRESDDPNRQLSSVLGSIF